MYILMDRKLVYITNDPMPTGRAYGNQITKLCEAFADFGLEVELVCLGKKIADQPDFFDYFGVKNNFVLRPVFIFDFLKLEPYLGRLSFYLQGLIFWAKLSFMKISRNSYIYTRQPEIVWLMGLRGFAVYYEDHGGTDKTNRLFLGLIKKAAGIVVINGFIKKEFVKNGINPDNILIAPSGVDLNNFAISVSREEAIQRLNLEDKLGADLKNKKVLMYTGNFKTKGVDKGIDEILRALADLKDSGIVFLAVGGSAPEIDFYTKMADELGVKNARFLPRQSQKDLALFQRVADVLLMPFPEKAHYGYFMSPVKMFEYMASGRPIIASDLPSIKEVLNDKNALLVKEGDHKDLAKGISAILGNKGLGESLAKQALADVGQYSWPERVKKILNFIKNEKNN